MLTANAASVFDRSRKSMLGLALSGVVVATPAIAVGPSPAAAKPACAGVTALTGTSWTVIHMPAWPADDARYQQANVAKLALDHEAVDPAQPTHLFASPEPASPPPISATEPSPSWRRRHQPSR